MQCQLEPEPHHILSTLHAGYPSGPGRAGAVTQGRPGLHLWQVEHTKKCPFTQAFLGIQADSNLKLFKSQNFIFFFFFFFFLFLQFQSSLKLSAMTHQLLVGHLPAVHPVLHPAAGEVDGQADRGPAEQPVVRVPAGTTELPPLYQCCTLSCS